MSLMFTANLKGRSTFYRRGISRTYSLLEYAPLFQKSGFINGQFLPLSSRDDLFEVKNPSDGLVITRVQNMHREHTLEAIEAASQAWKTWKLTIGVERSIHLIKIIHLMQKHKDDLSKIITMESGNRLIESLLGVQY